MFTNAPTPTPAPDTASMHPLGLDMFYIAYETLEKLPELAGWTCVYGLFVWMISRVCFHSSKLFYPIGNVPDVTAFAVRIVLIFMVAAIILERLGVHVGGALMSFGFISFALSFAMRDTFSNMIAGFIIRSSDDIAVGQNVQFAHVQGRIKEIKLRRTLIEGKDMLWIVPNQLLMETPIMKQLISKKPPPSQDIVIQ